MAPVDLSVTISCRKRWWWPVAVFALYLIAFTTAWFMTPERHDRMTDGFVRWMGAHALSIEAK